MLIDTHCHLDDERLYPLAESVISDMAKDGLYCVVTSSSDYASSVCNFALATNNRDVYATVGIHPQEASGRTTAQYDEFCKMAENEKVVAIGEVGLDYYYENSPREIQKTVLVEQMELAHFLRLPLVFHVRDAYGDFFDILKDNKKLLEYGGTVHCFSGTAEYAKSLLKYDLYFGFDGPITYKNARHSVEAAAEIPVDKLLVETDSPYLAPTPLRGTINLPKNVRLVAEKLAAIKNLSINDIEEITTNNAKRLFKKIK